MVENIKTLQELNQEIGCSKLTLHLIETLEEYGIDSWDTLIPVNLIMNIIQMYRDDTYNNQDYQCLHGTFLYTGR